MKAIQIEAYGNPTEVVKVVDLPDVGAPVACEVVIEVEASPINPYDLVLIAGEYGYRPQLPAIMGTVSTKPAAMRLTRTGARPWPPWRASR
jgi:NADPH:quinone reductase-like Zn-dependent oxidoreductase